MHVTALHIARNPCSVCVMCVCLYICCIHSRQMMLMMLMSPMPDAAAAAATVLWHITHQRTATAATRTRSRNYAYAPSVVMLLGANRTRCSLTEWYVCYVVLVSTSPSSLELARTYGASVHTLTHSHRHTAQYRLHTLVAPNKTQNRIHPVVIVYRGATRALAYVCVCVCTRVFAVACVSISARRQTVSRACVCVDTRPIAPTVGNELNSRANGTTEPNVPRDDAVRLARCAARERAGTHARTQTQPHAAPEEPVSQNAGKCELQVSAGGPSAEREPAASQPNGDRSPTADRETGSRRVRAYGRAFDQCGVSSNYTCSRGKHCRVAVLHRYMGRTAAAAAYAADDGYVLCCASIKSILQ